MARRARSLIIRAVRRKLFPTEPGGVASGAASLTEGDDAAAVIDLAVIGCRGDGKTQFILNAIRTLDAYAAPELQDVERENSQRIHRIALDARAPSLDATAPGARPHYVYRVEPHTLLAQLDGGARLALLARTARLWTKLVLAVLNGAAIGAGLWALGKPPEMALGAGAGLVVLMAIVAVALARRRFENAGEIEVVFWDVAGEDALKGGDYHDLLRTVVERRREEDRPYGFAPVLVCNPLSLEWHKDGGSYVNLRKLLPTYASLDRQERRALVVVTRSELIEEICADGSDADEKIAVRSRVRRNAHGRADSSAEPIDSNDAVVVRRGAVQRHCRDVEDGIAQGVSVTYLRYEAGEDCVLESKPGESGQQVVEYTYTDDVAAFEGEARTKFLSWLGEVAYRAPRASRSAMLSEKVMLTPEPMTVVGGPETAPAPGSLSSGPGAGATPTSSAASSGGFSSGGN
jgi:hypothetical protein